MEFICMNLHSNSYEVAFQFSFQMLRLGNGEVLHPRIFLVIHLLTQNHSRQELRPHVCLLRPICPHLS